MLGGSDDGLIGIVVGEIHVCLLLDGGIVPAIIDTQRYQIDVVTLHAAGLDGRVLRFEIAGKLGPVMSSIGFRENSKVATLVLGKLCVEGL